MSIAKVWRKAPSLTRRAQSPPSPSPSNTHNFLQECFIPYDNIPKAFYVSISPYSYFQYPAQPPRCAHREFIISPIQFRKRFSDLFLSTESSQFPSNILESLSITHLSITALSQWLIMSISRRSYLVLLCQLTLNISNSIRSLSWYIIAQIINLDI